MEVHEDDPCLRAQGLDLAQGERERVVERGHEDAAHQVQHADGLAGARASDEAAAARHAGGEVGGPQQLRLPRDVVEHFLLVPDVVAGGHHVHAVAEDRIGHVAGDAKAGGGVLDVGDDEVDAVAARPAPGSPAARSRAPACRRCRR